MKHITTYILAMGIGLAGLTSCSDSWLETNSTQATEGNTLFATTSNARLAINGLCRTMVQQHSYYGQSFNGEGTMKLLLRRISGRNIFLSVHGSRVVSSDER